MSKHKVAFWSSTEYSGFLAGLIRELNESGVEAKQRFQISEASYRSAKSTPARLWLRFRQYVAYPAQLIVALGKRRVKGDAARQCGDGEPKVCPELAKGDEGGCPLGERGTNWGVNDICVVSTNTFYAPLLATYLHPNVVHLVYDLFPEAMIHSGKWQEGTLKVKLVRWITKQTLRRSKQNVFLGKRLKDYVESIHGAVPNATIIAVGADQALFAVSPTERESAEMVRREACPEGVTETGALGAVKEQRESEGESVCSGNQKTGFESKGLLSHSTVTHHSAPTVLYCGNFGNMHDSETLFEYWKKVGTHAPMRPVDSHSLRTAGGSRPYPRFQFHCSGPKRAELVSVCDELPDAMKGQIVIGGGLSQSEWVNTMEAADVALVTMTSGAETVVMPSKTYSAMMAGQAILAIAPEDSDLVDLIKSAECGWWVEPGDVDGLASVIDGIESDSEGLLEKRERAYDYAHANFGQDALAKEWMELFERM